MKQDNTQAGLVKILGSTNPADMLYNFFGKNQRTKKIRK
jgi:hypothetical protein